MTDAVSSLRKLISKENLMKVIAPMTFNDLNTILYKCEEEEKDFSGFGSYNIPNYGTVVYAGLQGIHSAMADVALRNDTGHPICNNLRAGDWLMGNNNVFIITKLLCSEYDSLFNFFVIEYTYSRLLKNDGTKTLGELLKKCTECVHEIPRYLVPSYFDIVIRNVYLCCIDESWKKMST